MVSVLLLVACNNKLVLLNLFKYESYGGELAGGELAGGDRADDAFELYMCDILNSIAVL